MRLRRSAISLALTVGVLAPAVAASAAGAWTVPITVSPAAVSASRPSISISNDGSRMAMSWQAFNGVNSVIQTSVSTDQGATWSAPATVSMAALNWASSKVVLSGDGKRANAVWRSDDGHNNVRTASSADGGATWSAPVTVSSLAGSASGVIATSSTDGSHLSMVWRDGSGAKTTALTASSLDGGATWTAPRTLSNPLLDSALSYLQPIAASDDGTTVHAVWELDTGLLTRVVAAHSSDGGVTWSAAVNVSMVIGGGSNPAVVTSSDGKTVLVAYEQTRTAIPGIAWQKSTDGGATWSAVKYLSAVGEAAVNPSATLSDDGKVSTIAWQRQAAGDVQAATTADGGDTWTAAKTLSTAAGVDPYLAAANDGSRVSAAWLNSADSAVEVASSADTGATWSAPVQLSAAGVHGAEQRIASSASGRLVGVTWYDDLPALQPVQLSVLSDPAPNPTPDPVNPTAQVPVKPVTWAAKVKPHRWVKVVRASIVTNANQKATITASAVVASTGKAATKRQFKTRVKQHKFWVWSSGKRKLRINVALSAPAAPGFTQYSALKTYTVRKR